MSFYLFDSSRGFPQIFNIPHLLHALAHAHQPVYGTSTANKKLSRKFL